MSRDEDALQPIISSVRRVYYTLRKREPIAAVLDTMDALGFVSRFDQRPVLSRYHKTQTGWALMFTLPPGIASKDIKAKAEYFSEQAGGTVTVRNIGKTLMMDICLTSPNLRVKCCSAVPYLLDFRLPTKMSARGLSESILKFNKNLISSNISLSKR